MPKDYSNTSVYKICCKDAAIKDVYVGHTTCFKHRKRQHEQSCKRLIDFKLYKFIRNNGGWDNWEMTEIAKYNCKNGTEARIKEQQHFEELHATLNSVKPCRMSSLWIGDAKNVTGLEQKSEAVVANEEVKGVDVKRKYNCVECDYGCYRKSSWEQHLRTMKHDMMTKQLAKSKKKYICPICETEFRHSSSHSRHKKLCKTKSEKTKSEKTKSEKTKSEKTKVEVENQVVDGNVSDKELIMLLIKQNSELIEILKGSALTKNNTMNNTDRNNNACVIE